MRDIVVAVGCLSHDQSRCVRSCSVIILVCDPDCEMMAKSPWQQQPFRRFRYDDRKPNITHSRAKSEKIFFERRALSTLLCCAVIESDMHWHPVAMPIVVTTFRILALFFSNRFSTNFKKKNIPEPIKYSRDCNCCSLAGIRTDGRMKNFLNKKVANSYREKPIIFISKLGFCVRPRWVFPHSRVFEFTFLCCWRWAQKGHPR